MERTEIMKICIAIAIIMLAAGGAAAQWDTETNVMTMLESLNTTPYDWDCFYREENQTHVMSLFLHNPVNPDYGVGEERAVTAVAGFECRVTGTEGVNILAWDFPVAAFDFGEGDDLKVVYSEPVPVTGDYVVLATCEVFFGDVVSFELPEAIMARCSYYPNAWLHVDPLATPSLPGVVAYTDADDPYDPLVAGQSRSPGHDVQFEIYQDQSVDIDSRSWGAMKALYE
jgi:hypothetical protein